MEAYVHGVSTRKVDDLVAALGVDPASPSARCRRICAELDTEVARLARPRRWPSSAFPYVFLDATYCKARVGGRVVSRAVVIATGVAADGRREVLGVDVGDSENEAFWTAFLRWLRARGLTGVQLVISDAHRGLTNAIGAVLHRRGLAALPGALHAQRAGQGAQGPRRDGRRRDPHDLRPARRRRTSATSSTSSPPCSSRQFPDGRRACCATPARTSLAFADFPQAHWRKIWSTNPLERLNNEVKRRTDVVGIFPNAASLLRLAGAAS